MASSEHILTLTRKTLDEFETVGLSASCRRAFRVAQLQGHADDAWLFRADLRPHGGSTHVRQIETSALFPDREYADVRTADAKLREIWIQERQPTIPDILAERLEKDILLVGSIDDLERNLRQLDGGTTIEVDLNARVELQQRAAMDAEILDRIRTRTFAYLCRVETDLSIAVATAHIFDAHRSRVDQFLRDVASDVLEKFSSAYRRVAEGEKESGSQALTSCRRILKEVADVVSPGQRQPVTGADGKTRDLTDDKYINRIAHFYSQTPISGTLADSFRATLDDIGNRLHKLNELTGKGVHDDVNVREVEWCVIQTYLLAGEILQLYPIPSTSGSQDSPDLAVPEGDPAVTARRSSPRTRQPEL